MTNFRLYALLFIIQPFLALIVAFYNKRWELFRVVLWLYAGYYGFTIAVGAESQGSDIVRYIAEMQSLHNKSFDTLSSYWSYYQNSGEIDFLRSFLAISVSRFTESQNVLLLIYGLIFGYFYSGNTFLVLKYLRLNTFYNKLLFFSFLLIMPLWTMGGFRFNTSVHMFTYGVLLYFFEGNRKALIYCFLTPLVHFSFLIPVSLLVGFSFFKKMNIRFFFLFFALSFFAPSFSSNTIQTYINSVGNQTFQERTDSYVDENKVSNYRESSNTVFSGKRNWYADLYTKGYRWVIFGYLLLFYFKRKSLTLKNKENILFKLSLLIFGFTNLIDDIPSGKRFFLIAELIATALILVVLYRHSIFRFIKIYKLVSLPLVLLFLIVSIRAGLLLTSVEGVFANPLLVLFMNGEYTDLNSLLRAITG
ncbi:EpsG family protein [Salibacter halophilus]|uniref:EpsG family protein n=1 Tax=Salibacter halophilus TaxID=1803916 RepID=A0A6N6M733_9FLAO|nr:EpsG family protein [Salibacter halophilus]KAB1063539.1 hypothetical protein F3059_10760 [Salibacter halophilus]